MVGIRGRRSHSVWRRIAIVLGVAFLAFVTLVVVMNVRNYRYRTRYRATEFGILDHAIILELFCRRTGAYPSPGLSGNLLDLPESTQLVELSRELRAKRPWKGRDAWGNSYFYAASRDGQHYALASGMSDGRLEKALVPDVGSYPYKTIEKPSEDLVVIDGDMRQQEGTASPPDNYRELSTADLEAMVLTGALAK